MKSGRKWAVLKVNGRMFAFEKTVQFWAFRQSNFNRLDRPLYPQMFAHFYQTLCPWHSIVIDRICKSFLYILLTVSQWILTLRHIIYIDVDFDFRFFARRNTDSIFSLYHIRRLLLQTWRKSWNVMHRRKLWWIVHRKIFICSEMGHLYSKVLKSEFLVKNSRSNMWLNFSRWN